MADRVDSFCRSSVPLRDTEPVPLETSVNQDVEDAGEEGSEPVGSLVFGVFVVKIEANQGHAEEDQPAQQGPQANGADGNDVEEVGAGQLVSELGVGFALDEESEVEPAAEDDW